MTGRTVFTAAAALAGLAGGLAAGPFLVAGRGGSGDHLAAAGCGPHAGLVAELAGRYGEVVMGRGIGPGRLVEILAGPSGSWSLISTDPTGRSCLWLSGEAWHMRPPPPPPGTGL